ncbi:hypothetical protein OUZ56_030607 [Daphnia magna]|uniref:non-specific serine/threonine protein kinase n=1 Tax=Daphnia magna TaxID=35525 RepID=A0ABQ9ZRT5_9CRUS|nr:hypothetical protein OUZ56_030607 [Daphnia magna]
MDRVLHEEFENGNPQEDGKKMFDPEDYSGTDSDEDEVQYGARRRKPDKAALRGNKLYGDKTQGRGKVLIFSPSPNHENGRGRGRDYIRTRGRGSRGTLSEDHEDGANYSRKNFRSKAYDKSTDLAENFSSEDGRIGRQLRLLSRETDEEVICKICQQLQEAFLLQDNLRYIRYNLIPIANSLIETYKVANSAQARQAISLAISKLGYVSDHDFNSFAKWILSAYQKEANEKVCCSIMDALTEMLKLNEKNSRLKNVDTLLLPGLQSALESADTPDLFESSLNPVLLIAVKNPTSFLPCFRDTVDILVGWFVDPAQPVKVVRSATRALQILRPFWKEDLSFSKTLLSQFLEDLDAYAAETNALLVTPVSPGEDVLAVSLRKIASLLSVFMVVGAQVCVLPETAIFSPGFLNNALLKVSFCAGDLLRQVGKLDETDVEGNALGDTIQFANGCTSLLVGWLGNRVSPEAVKSCFDFLEDQVKSATKYEYPLLISMLQLMTSLAEQHIVSSHLPLETIQSWMEVASWLIRSTRSREVLTHVAKLLRAVVKVKNVSLLIEVYRRLATDLDNCFTTLKENSKGKVHVCSETEENALLLLSPLADLGRSSSLVGMWALEPSLLELLAGKLQPADQIQFLYHNHPALCLGILRVLHCHAKSHSHFVANSCLLINASSGSKNLHGCISPTSGNLSLILNLLADLCLGLHRASTCEASKILILQWSGQLLDTCKPCTSQLNQSELFQRFLSSVVGFCESACSRHPFAVELLLVSLLDLPDITVKTDLASQIAMICINQIRNQSHSSNFLHLLGRFPSQIVQLAICRTKNDLLTGLSLSSWVQNETPITARSSLQFFDLIFKGVPVASFESIYSFYVGSSKNNIAQPTNCDLPLWLAVQSALLCVNSKLRTPLGKAQDTFLAIEDAIKSAAGRPSGQETVTEQNLAQLSRIRLLLSFYEMLEKFMYNAFDGCSIALPLAPKAIRVFFRTNQTTCQEWVNRMGSSALTASVRAGRHASAVRFGLNLLTHWTHSRRAVDIAELENILQQIVQSMIKLGAFQQIRGLKSWILAPKQAEFFQSIDVEFLEAAALQAESKYENAIELYSKIEGQPSTFICSQVIDSYLALSDWEGFAEWKSHAADWLGNVPQQKKQIADLMEAFDRNGQLQWPEKSSSAMEVQWTVDSLMNEAKSGLSMAANQIRSARSVYLAPTSSWKVMEFLVGSSLELLNLTVEDKLTSLLPLAHALSYKNESAYAWMQHTHAVLKGASCTGLKFASSNIGVEWSRWLLWYSSLDRQASDIAIACAEVDLSIVPQARVEGNLRLAERQLLRSMTNSQVLNQAHDMATQLMNEALKMKLTCVSSTRLAIKRQFEGAKLLHQKGDTDAAISVLTQCSLALSRSLQSPQSAVDTILPYMAESYTLLATWLQQSLESATPLKNITTLKELANAGAVDHEDHATLVSKLMERASELCPSSSEAWLAWGQYQYSRAQQNTHVKSLPTGALPVDDINRLADNLDELSGDLEMVLTADSTLSKKPAVLKRLVSEVQSRRILAISNYKGCLKAFFQYLNLRGSSSDQRHHRDTVDVTLRILCIFSRHLKEVDSEWIEILSEAIERTPSGAWRSITPQLLSLMQHGRPWLRALTSRLLSRLASEWPQLLVFPVAVGAAGLAWSWSTDPTSLEEPDKAEPEEKETEAKTCTASELQTVYQGMMDEMTTQVPNMVQDVRLLLTELRRLVLLWDELWVAVLQQIHPQVEQLLQKLQTQMQKLNKKTGLSETDKKELLQKHFIVLFKPVLLVLEAITDITNVPPQTPHENWFTQRYSKTIIDGIENLKEGCNSERAVTELWLPFKNMLQQLQHISYRRSVLKLDDVSPALRQMRDTKIPMPGVNDSKQGSTLFIKSVENVIIVLPTKTKPKKFLFVGTDGKRYAYLFKGMEDLHLDQRIMQVLSLTNVLLSESKNRYRARHYGVIPLGPRSGLIQWVEGVTPLFALYKRWLQRQAANTTQGKGEKDNNVTAVPRPSELFYNKLTPLLEAEGLSADPRQRNQWPIDILRRVQAELMEETPKDLVAREMWAGSVNAEQWWSSTLRFGQSCAVTSVIGYIIGLGDRHLDNVLVDLRCGEVVHIDYNVCFEKGRQLRVPENVPFRMTANIQHALGAAGTGLEGTFRLSSIDVMRMMRENQELFKILLEQFVYDPLIDWRTPVPSTSHESTLIPLYVVNPALATRCSIQKRNAEADATFKLFELRMSELGPDWSFNHNDMTTVLSALKDTSSAWEEVHNQIERLQEEVQDLHQDRLVLFDVRSDKNHVMRQPQQLSGILLPLRTAWEGEKNVRVALRALVEDNAKWTQLYIMAFSSLNSGQLKQWADQTSSTSVLAESNETGFPLVVEFLNTSGQTVLAHQGQLLDQQVRTFKESQQMAASVVINLLGTYSSLAAQYPSDNLEAHRTRLFSVWANDLEENLCTETCQRLVAAFQNNFDIESPVLASKQQRIIDFNLSLRRLLNEASMRLHQASLQLAEEDVHSGSNERIMKLREALSEYRSLHGQQSVNWAVLESLYRVYQEIDSIQSQSIGTFDTVMVACGQACCVSEFLSMSDSTDETISNEVTALKLLDQLHQDMQEFIFNGTTIVLPELIRLFECSDKSVLQLHEELEVLCIDINLTKMEMTRLRFQDLLGEGIDGEVRLTQGQMLLLCLNGLFEKVESGLVKLANYLKTMPAVENHMELLEETQHRMKTEFDNLEDTLLGQRLMLMMSLFQSCSDWAVGFQTGQISRELQQDSFVDKFQRMANAWVVQFLSGATSFCLARLCIRLAEHPSTNEEAPSCIEDLITMKRNSIKSLEFNEEQLDGASVLKLITDLIEVQWRKCESVKLARQRQEIDQCLAQLLQQQLSAHSWLHDTNAGINSPCGLFIHNLKQSLSVLLSQSPQLTELHQQLTQLATQVEQRLKWAAGANSNILKVLNEFTEMQSKCLLQLQSISSLATGLASVSSAILHYESFRTRTPEALAADSTFIQLLSQCQDVCLLKDCGTNGRLTDAEVRLARRINVGEDGATDDWINQTEKSISDKILLSKERMTELLSIQSARVEELHQLNGTMRSQLAVHHQLISDVRSILKTMAKCETENGPVSQYLEKYRLFSECCSLLSRHLAAKDYDSKKITEIQSEIGILQQTTSDIYEGLQQLCGVLTKTEQQVRNSNEVNAIAASIWHRVRLKLEGRDPDPNKQLTVEEQVDAIIEEATNVDNLALLYEGWTPWV